MPNFRSIRAAVWPAKRHEQTDRQTDKQTDSIFIYIDIYIYIYIYIADDVFLIKQNILTKKNVTTLNVKMRPLSIIFCFVKPLES